MRLLTLSADDVRHALPMRDAVAAMKDAFAALSSGHVVAPQRGVLPVAPRDGTVLLMGAFLPGQSITAKTVAVFPHNAARGLPTIHGLSLALDPDTGAPAALCDGAFLTAWRTGAASGAATDLLARPDCEIGAVLGCGAQGHTQVQAIDCVRELAEIRVFDPTPQRVAALVDEIQPLVRARLLPCSTAKDAVTGADVVCAATSSSTPVFDDLHLGDGAHVNGIGSFRPEMCELDQATIARARIFVDTRAAASAEAGELIAATAAGITRPEDWTELGAVAAGSPGRGSPVEITVFKSVGQAAQDAVAMARVLDGARRRGLGRSIEL